ncbi:MAG: hypothetical protein V4787_03155 [Pseudomonadota bacterium]
MNENRTTSILQRLPVILAVTAASYGLNAQAQAQRTERGERAQHTVSAKSDEGANALERMREAIAAQD